MPPSVTHNQAQHRFEVELGDEKGLLEYAIKGNQIDLHHTEVPPGHQHQGVGEGLVRAALDYARQTGLKVVASCPFVAAFVAEHPEYQENIAK